MDGEGYYNSYKLKRKVKLHIKMSIAICYTCSINGLSTPNVLCEIIVICDFG